jgi:hypothetical protein
MIMHLLECCTASYLLDLQARIDLRHDMATSPAAPISAGLGHHIWQLSFLLYICWSFEKIDVHALADVPSNVTSSKG